MGSGQSRSGNTKNYNRNAQYPYGAPQYPYGQPFAPGYGGYPQPMYGAPPPGFNLQQPGFVPPGQHFGQGQHLPPPLLNFLPGDKQHKKSRRSKRTQSERFVGGFAQSSGMPQPEAPRRTRSESHPRQPVEAPVVPSSQHGAPNPGQGPLHRTPTPFLPAFGHESETDDEEEEDRPRSANHNRDSSRRSRRRYPSPPPVVAELANVLDPLEPASSSAFGPRGERPRTPLRNPLPPPPRDLYEMTPYRSLLSLPQTTALLTATYGPQQAMLTTGTSALNREASTKSKKSGKGGLLRAFSRKDKQKAPEQPQVRFIPVFVPSNNNNNNNEPSASTSPQGQPPNGSGIMSQNAGFASSPAGSGTPSDQPMPVPPQPSSPPAIRFDQHGKYAVFMNHSPHRVIYRNTTYPTALHLHEALKFLDHRPDLAERIRAADRPEEVYPLSSTFQQFVRQDWGLVYLDLMKEVLYQKFRQHPDLRTMLLSTGAARLIYVDSNDTYWGAGLEGNGQNLLGKALVEVRQRLINEAPTAMGSGL